MKKILTIFAILMVAVVGRVSADDAIVWTEVSSAQDFVGAILKNPSANVKLTADINLSEVSSSDWEVFNNFTFKGKLTGEKSDGTNYAIISNGKTNGGILFEKVDGATISRITFKNFQWDGDNTEKIAVVARESSNGTYEYLTITNCSINKDNSEYVDEIGGFVAISKNETFTHCTTTSDCFFDGNTGNGDVNIGGIVGKAYNCTFTMCHNGAEIYTDFAQSGGLVAYASACKFDRCLNTGKITGKSECGGIVGNAAYGTIVERCVNTGYMGTCDNSTYVKRGGIVGLLHHSG